MIEKETHDYSLTDVNRIGNLKSVSTGDMVFTTAYTADELKRFNFNSDSSSLYVFSPEDAPSWPNLSSIATNPSTLYWDRSDFGIRIFGGSYWSNMPASCHRGHESVSLMQFDVKRIGKTLDIFLCEGFCDATKPADLSQLTCLLMRPYLTPDTNDKCIYLTWQNISPKLEKLRPSSWERPISPSNVVKYTQYGR